MINRLCGGKLKTSSYASGPTWGPTKQNFRKSQFFERFGSGSCVLQLAPYDVKLIRATGGAKRDSLARAPSKSWGTCCCARAVSHIMLLRRTRAPKWEHICLKGGFDVKDRRAHRLRDGSLEKRNLRAVNWPGKTQRLQWEISIVQSIQLGFSRSLGSTTSNEAYKSAMRRAEWTITARQAVLHLAQMKYRYFVPERWKQNAIFSDTSHHNRAYLYNVLTNRWYIVAFQQRHCSSKVTDENIKTSLPILQVLTPKFYRNSIWKSDTLVKSG